MNIQIITQKLSANLSQQTRLATVLLETLVKEHQALGDRQYDDPQILLKQKEEQAKALELQAAEQQGLLEAAGVNNDAKGFEQLFAKLPQSVAAKLKHQKDALETLLEKCQDQNLVNGQIIAINHQSAETALAILRGQLSDDNLGYTAGGKTVSQTNSTSITKA